VFVHVCVCTYVDVRALLSGGDGYVYTVRLSGCHYTILHFIAIPQQQHHHHITAQFYNGSPIIKLIHPPVIYRRS
jgi:hypothetical protein